MKFYILDNANEVHEIKFDNVHAACNWFKTHYILYFKPIMSRNPVVLCDSDKKFLIKAGRKHLSFYVFDEWIYYYPVSEVEVLGIDQFIIEDCTDLDYLPICINASDENHAIEFLKKYSSIFYPKYHRIRLFYSDSSCSIAFMQDGDYYVV